MQTQFTLAQLADAAIAESDAILRKCVHCGFCLATCPTYVVRGDERDSPRGRIYMMKNMLESGAAADRATVTHIDRCLTCLSCITTCPAGVDYMHLVDHARTHIARTYQRPIFDRILRDSLNAILPFTQRFGWALRLGRLARPLGVLVQGRLRALLSLAPRTQIQKQRMTYVFHASGKQIGRVALLDGCVQPVLRPKINEAAIRLLNRRGIEVVIPPQAGCCGALSHHLTRDDDAVRFAKANIDAWLSELDNGGVDAILVTASGCGTMIKDYGHLLAHDPVYAGHAKRISSLARDVSEFIAQIGIGPVEQKQKRTVAYHSACSLQHGQRVNQPPRELLRAAGFDVREVTEGHLCCGSAGIYNMLEPDISNALLARKAANIERTGADIVATGNIGCITQLERGTKLPIVHTVELLDWATGGPMPDELSAASSKSA